MEKAADAAAAAAKTTDTSQKSLPPNSPDSIRSNSSSHHHSNLSSNNSSPTISQKHLPKPATVSPATSLKKLQFAALTTTIQPASPTSVVSAARNSIYNDGPISKSTSISSNVGTTLTSATPAPIIFRQQPLSSSGQCPLSSAGLRNELFNASKSNIYQNTESNGISSGGAGGSSSGRVSENSNPGGRDSKSIGQSAASNSSTTSGSNSGLNNSQAKNYWVNRLKRQNNHSIHQQTTQIINVYPNILKNTHSSGIIVVHSSSKSLAKSGSGSSVNNNGDSNLGSSNSLAKSGGGSYKQFVALKGSSSNILRPSNSRGNLLGGSLQTNISIPELSRPDGGETSVKKVGIAGLSMFLNTEYDSTGSSGSNCEVEVKLTSFGSGGEGAASRALKISSKKTTAPFRSESKNSLDIIKQITSRSALALPTSVISKSSVNHQSDFFNSSFNTDNMSTPAIIVVNTAASHISITNNIGDDDSDGGDDDIEIIADDDHHLDTYQTSKRKKGFSYVETALFDLLTRNECIGRGDLSPKSSAKNIMRISDPDLEDGARRQDDNQVQAGGGRYSISNQASTNSSQLSIESPKAAFPTALDSIDRPSLSFNNSGRRGSSVIRFQESRQEVKTSASTRRASIVSPHPMLTRRSSSISGYMSQTSGQMSQISRRASVSAAVAASFLSTPATPHQLPPITDDHKNNINLQSNSNNSSILQQQSPSSPHDYPPSTSNSIIQRSAQQSSSSHPHSGILHSHSVLFSTTNSNQPSVAPGAQIYMTHSLSANQLPNSPSGIPQSSNLGTFDGYIRPSLAAVTEPPKYTGGGTEKKALSNLDHKPSDGPQLNEPMQIVNQTLTMWEAFKRPFTVKENARVYPPFLILLLKICVAFYRRALLLVGPCSFLRIQSPYINCIYFIFWSGNNTD